MQWEEHGLRDGLSAEFSTGFTLCSLEQMCNSTDTLSVYIFFQVQEM